MAKLLPLESTNGDSRVGGFVVEFPSGARKSVSWVHAAPMPDSLAAAKEFATKLVEHCLTHNLSDDLNRTNIPSLVASIQKIVMDWNEARRADLYAERTNATPIQ